MCFARAANALAAETNLQPLSFFDSVLRVVMFS